MSPNVQKALQKITQIILLQVCSKNKLREIKFVSRCLQSELKYYITQLH